MLLLKTQNQHFLTKILLGVNREFECTIFKDYLSIKKTAKHFFMDIWLVFGSMLKLLHVEIVSF